MSNLTHFDDSEPLRDVLERINSIIDVLRVVEQNQIPAVVHNQSQASDSWVINHSFGRLPNVIVYDTAGSRLFADVTAATGTQIRIDFNGATAGVAVLT